jgi:hypothetical protein
MSFAVIRGEEEGLPSGADHALFLRPSAGDPGGAVALLEALAPPVLGRHFDVGE